MKGMKILLIVMLASFIIAFAWDKVPAIKNSAHFILDPSAGWLLNWNLNVGMIIIVFIITLITSLSQKYGTDQASLKEIKKEQKACQDEMKNHKDNPQKLMELQKKHMEFIPKTMSLTMKPLVYTSIPIILFFRWFNDYFTAIENAKVFGMNWFWFYLLASIIFSMTFKKTLKIE